MAPAELLTVGDHLARCAACRERLSSADHLRTAFAALGTDLEAAAERDPAHLPPEQMAAYVDNQLNQEDRAIAEAHFEACAECYTELLDLRRFKTLLTSLHAAQQPPTAPPAERARLVALWRRPGYWLPVSAAAAAVLLLAWLAIIPLRGQVERLNGQMSELQRRNTELEDRLSSFSESHEKTDQAAQTQTEMPSAEPRVVALNDGGSLVTLDKQGRLTGLKSLSPSQEQLIKTVLTTQRVSTAPVLAALRGKLEVLMGGAAGRDSFSVISPVGTAVESDRPTLRWKPLSGATSYTVTLYNTGSKKTIVSPQLSATEWTPPSSLERGEMYAWEVTALRDGKEFTAPIAPMPQARFSVINQTALDEINHARQTYGKSHLVLGLLYAQAGLRADAERELKALAVDNADSLTVRNLIQSIRLPKIR